MATAPTPHPGSRRTSPPRRRLLGWAAALGAGAVTATGCARGTHTRAATGDRVTLNNDNATWLPGYRAASDVLRRTVGHRLAVRSVPNVSSYQQIVRMSAQTDSATDLVKWWNGYRLRDVARLGIFDDVTEEWDLAESRGWVDPSLRESFTHDGKPYALPMYKSYYAMYYSKPAFRRFDLDVPRRWEDLIEIARVLRDNGVTPIASGGSGTWESSIWFQQLLNGLDPAFYTALMDGDASYTDETAQQAMRIWVDMYEQDFFTLPDFSTTDAPGKFADGSLGMQLYATFNVNSLLAAGLDSDTFGLFLVPPVHENVADAVLVESAALALPSNAHKKEAAHEVARAWLKPAVQRAWIGFLNDFSANPEVLPSARPARELFAEVERRKPREATRYWEATPPVLVEGNVQELGAFMANPTHASARNALERMQQNAEYEWKRWSR